MAQLVIAAAGSYLGGAIAAYAGLSIAGIASGMQAGFVLGPAFGEPASVAGPDLADFSNLRLNNSKEGDHEPHEFLC